MRDTYTLDEGNALFFFCPFVAGEFMSIFLRREACQFLR